MKKATVLVFKNGNVAVLSNNEQIAELQKTNLVQILDHFFKSKGYEFDEIELSISRPESVFLKEGEVYYG